MIMQFTHNSDANDYYHKTNNSKFYKRYRHQENKFFFNKRQYLPSVFQAPSI